MSSRMDLILLVCVFVGLTGCAVPPPLPPSAPEGPVLGDIGESYDFTAETYDPASLPLQYRFAWGDGQTSDWGQLLPSGMPCTETHAWQSEGFYEVRAQARNAAKRLSSWSPPHFVTIGSGSGYPDSVIAVIGGMSGPVGMDVTADGQYLYVACRGERLVRVYRTSDNIQADQISVGNGAYDVCILPNGQYAYVPNVADRTVSVIRMSDNAVIATVPVSDGPIHCEALPNSEYVYVSNQMGNSVSVVSTDSNKVIATVPVSGWPWGLAAKKGGEYMYVACSALDRLAIIRTSDNTVTGYVTLHDEPEAMCMTPDSAYLYVTCRTYSAGYVDVVRTEDDSLVATIPVSGYPCVVTMLPGGEYVYVACHNSGEVCVISTATREVVWSTDYFSGACYMAARPDGSRVYLCALHENHVIVLGRD